MATEIWMNIDSGKGLLPDGPWSLPGINELNDNLYWEEQEWSFRP